MTFRDAGAWRESNGRLGYYFEPLALIAQPLRPLAQRKPFFSVPFAFTPLGEQPFAMTDSFDVPHTAARWIVVVRGSRRSSYAASCFFTQAPMARMRDGVPFGLPTVRMQPFAARENAPRAAFAADEFETRRWQGVPDFAWYSLQEPAFADAMWNLQKNALP